MDYEQTGMLLNQRITDDPNSKPKLMGQTCRLWRDLIETYSRNFLTNSQDKLIASSGIANCMRQITRGEYVASLWQGGGGGFCCKTSFGMCRFERHVVRSSSSPILGSLAKESPRAHCQRSTP